MKKFLIIISILIIVFGVFNLFIGRSTIGFLFNSYEEEPETIQLSYTSDITSREQKLRILEARRIATNSSSNKGFITYAVFVPEPPVSQPQTTNNVEFAFTIIKDIIGIFSTILGILIGLKTLKSKEVIK
ncbi:MAG: hypothetical protein ACOC3V_01540 [bacterium]